MPAGLKSPRASTFSGEKRCLSSSPSPCSSHFENGMLKPRLRRLMTSEGRRLLTVFFRMSLVLFPLSLRADGIPAANSERSWSRNGARASS